MGSSCWLNSPGFPFGSPGKSPKVGGIFEMLMAIHGQQILIALRPMRRHVSGRLHNPEEGEGDSVPFPWPLCTLCIMNLESESDHRCPEDVFCGYGPWLGSTKNPGAAH